MNNFFDVLKRSLEALVYVICVLFLIIVLLSVAIFIIKLTIEKEVFKYHMLGVSIIALSIFSIAYIAKYNNKYRKNDSNTSEGQDDFFFESNLFKEDRRNANRRDVE